MTESPYMQTAEAADRLGVCQTVVRKWFDAKKLDGYKIPDSGYRRITRESVERVRAQMHGERE